MIWLVFNVLYMYLVYKILTELLFSSIYLGLHVCLTMYSYHFYVWRFSQHHRKHSSGGSDTVQLVRLRTTDTLQKTMSGGIFLIELSFQDVYFVVKLYVFNATQLPALKETYTLAKKVIVLGVFGYLLYNLKSEA